MATFQDMKRRVRIDLTPMEPLAVKHVEVMESTNSTLAEAPVAVKPTRSLVDYDCSDSESSDADKESPAAKDARLESIPTNESSASEVAPAGPQIELDLDSRRLFVVEAAQQLQAHVQSLIEMMKSAFCVDFVEMLVELGRLVGVCICCAEDLVWIGSPEAGLSDADKESILQVATYRVSRSYWELESLVSGTSDTTPIASTTAPASADDVPQEWSAVWNDANSTYYYANLTTVR